MCEHRQLASCNPKTLQLCGSDGARPQPGTTLGDAETVPASPRFCRGGTSRFPGKGNFEQIQRHNTRYVPVRSASVGRKRNALLELSATNRATFQEKKAIPAGGFMTLYRETP